MLPFEPAAGSECPPVIFPYCAVESLKLLPFASTISPFSSSFNVLSKISKRALLPTEITDGIATLFNVPCKVLPFTSATVAKAVFSGRALSKVCPFKSKIIETPLGIAKLPYKKGLAILLKHILVLHL